MGKIQPNKHKQPLALNVSFGEPLERFANVTTRDLTDIGPEEPPQGKATPFVKWVGGKRSIIEALKAKLPKDYNNYYEPFVGGGALFFETLPEHAFLSDSNLELMLTYKVVQKGVEALIARLEDHKTKHSAKYYYEVRKRHCLQEPVEIAARMIYLNKTCFNGLYRVNQKGEFNVPIGKYAKPGICQQDNLRLCSKALQGVNIRYGDYKNIAPQKGDFCYFDPPYYPTTKTSFTAYSERGFSAKDQCELAEFCTQLHKKGVKIMVSNSNTTFIKDLYKSNIFNVASVDAPRLVNCKPNGRNAVKEVLVTNY